MDKAAGIESGSGVGLCLFDLANFFLHILSTTWNLTLLSLLGVQLDKSLGCWCPSYTDKKFTGFAPIILDLRSNSFFFFFFLQRQDCWGPNVLESNYRPILYTPHKYRSLGFRTFALPVPLQENPLVKSASVALTR